jgi:alpha-tubulin suppressor-like RCC1 family protein
MYAPALFGVGRPVQRVLVAAILFGLVERVAVAGPVAAGNAFTLVAMPDGTVVAWGQNGSGQLGQGNQQPKAVPTIVPGLTDVVAVSAGFSHSLALTSGGLVYAFGANSSKQLGDTTTTMRTSPILVGLSGVIAIAAGDYHSVALTNDGNVWVWGSGQYGQTGVNSTSNIGTPTMIAALSNVTAIAAGSGHTMVRKSDSTVWVFGWNASGQLAQGNTTNALTPVQVSGVTTATAVAAGSLHSLILLADGTVKAAGYNQYGQAGDNTTTTPKTSLVTVTGLTNVTAIVGGGNHSGAIRTDGSLRLWGLGTSGQIGDSFSQTRVTATTPVAPSNAVHLTLGASHSLAVTSTGVVYTFGSNWSSELGDGTTQARSTPDTISGPNYTWKVGTPTFNPSTNTYTVEKTVAVSEATPGATIHYTLTGADPTESDPVVASGGTVQIDQSYTLKARAWNGTMPASNIATAVYTLQVATPTFSPTPTTYTTPQTVTLSTTTPGATLRYTLDGTTTPTASSPLYTGPLSIGTYSPIKVAGFRTGWTTSAVNAGTYTMNFGTLAAPTASPAAGTYTTSATVTFSAFAGATIRCTAGPTTPPDPIASTPECATPIPVTTSKIIKAKAFHADYTSSVVTTVAYTIVVAAPTFTPTAGTYSAGTAITIATATPGATIRYTTTGVDPTDTDPTIASGSTIPVGNFTVKAKATLTDATTSPVTTAAYVQTGSATTAMIDGGGGHAVAVRADGTAFGWGDNGSYAVGDGTNTDRVNPVLMSGVSGITHVSAGETHTLLRRSDGRVLAVGANGSGRLGDGTTTPRSFPVFASGITTAAAVSAGNDHSLVLLADGTVLAFGGNGGGQLGLGDTAPRNTPTVVPSLSNIVAISAGYSYSLALTASGTVYAFGVNGSGQLGVGDTTPRSTPTMIGSLSGVTGIAAGSATSAVLLSTGQVKTFGSNMSSQLGNGSPGQSTSPVFVSGLTDATAIAVGGSHMIARRADGTVVAWGYGEVLGAGPLGTNQWVPIPVPGLTDIAGVAAGTVESYVWRATGEVWSFGQNLDGRLGDSTLIQRYEPVPIAGPGFAWKVWTPTLSVAAGTYPTDQAVAVICMDPVWAGPTTLRYTTTGAVPTETDATVACGGTVAVAQSLTLRVSGWRAGAPTSEITTAAYTLQAPAPTITPGTGAYGGAQTITIATGTPASTVRYTLDGSEPTATSSVYAAPLSVGGTLTLKAAVFKTGWTTSVSGTASYWIAAATVATPIITPAGGGYAEAPLVTITTATSGATIRYTLDGSTPTGASTRYVLPFLASTTTTLKAKAFLAGQTPSGVAAATFALDAVGAVATPTLSVVGGRFTTQQVVTVIGPPGATLRYTTTSVDPTTSDAVVASGSPLTIDRSLVLKVRGFQAGLANSAVRRADFVITGALAAGAQHAIALKADGSVWAWGRGYGGLVGDGQTAADRLTPVSLPTAGPAVAIAAGANHSLVALATGGVKVWGLSSYGALGTGQPQHNAPTVVPGLSNVIAVATGAEHSLALTASGQLYAWGRNNRGQLGLGDATNRSAPTLVSAVTGAVAVSAGDGFSLVLTTDGAAGGLVWAFGANDVSQLGDGSTQDRSIPVRVVGLSDVTAIDAGGNWALARSADGTLWAFGSNTKGQRADGTTLAGSRLATRIEALRAADSISAGGLFGATLDRDGRLWDWGEGGYGQFGYGPLLDSPAPILNLGLPPPTVICLAIASSFVAKTDGTVWSTGNNLSGMLGTGSPSPVSVWTSTSGLTLVNQAWLVTDVDGDGLSAWREFLLGTDPLNSDTNGNGLPDGVDAAAGQPAANLDPDADGVTTARETAMGTDPYRADTDGDGVSDGADLYPFDPTRSALPPPTPGDTTPPVITLIEPTNAVPVP